MSKRIALIVHNDTYHDATLAQLKQPVADTAALVSLLLDPSIGNFDGAEVVHNPPVRALCQRLADFFHRKGRHDELLLYFVGQGLLDKTGQLYLATIDTDLDNLAETALAATELTQWMDRSFSRRQVLVLDCNYRHLGGDVSEVRPSTMFQGRGFGRAVLTATDTIRYGLADNRVDPAENSLTPLLLQALQTGAADADRDGQVELKELYAYLQPQLSPVYLRIYDRQDNFIVARNPHPFVASQSPKWDLISGAILTPLTIIVIGSWSDLRASIGLAGLFLLLYALLYLAPD